MPEVKGKPKSRYALKREGKLVTININRIRRVCDHCKLSLSGKKGHGFVTVDGRVVVGACCRKNPRYRA